MSNLILLACKRSQLYFTHCHSVLFAKQLDSGLIHYGGDIPQRLVQIFRVSLNEGERDFVATMLEKEVRCSYS